MVTRMLKALLVLFTAALVAIPGADALSQTAPKTARGPELMKPITAPEKWVKETSEKHPALLTNGYLFQVMKINAQRLQKQTETEAVLPMLSECLKGLYAAAHTPDTKRFFGVARALLGAQTLDADDSNIDDADRELSKVVFSQADELKRHPLFTPRGHYAGSEAGENYFRAMQYLTRTMIDVQVDPRVIPFPAHMIYPYDTLAQFHSLFRDPANKVHVDRWMIIHGFYGDINGPADFPTFADFGSLFKEGRPTRESIIEWCKERKLPKMNREAGYAVQPFGERPSIHGEVIDAFKEAFITNDTTKAKAAEFLRFKKLMKGAPDKAVPGLADHFKQDARTYYSKVYAAIGKGSQDWATDAWRMNFAGAALASLAEQTVLTAKISQKIVKSLRFVERPSGKYYFEPGAAEYLASLGEPLDLVADSCEKVIHAAENMSKEGDSVSEAESNGAAPDLTSPRLLAKGFVEFASLAKTGSVLEKDSDTFRAYGAFVDTLPGDPAIAVDVFHFKPLAGELSFLEWAVAPYEVKRALEDGAQVRGMELIFFEGWQNDAVPDAKTPLTNEMWREAIRTGTYKKLKNVFPPAPKKPVAPKAKKIKA